MKRIQILLAITLIFISGVVVGAVGGLALAHRHIVSIIEGGPEAVREVVMRRLTRVLDLTDEQRISVEAVVADAHEQIITLRRRHQPEAEEIIGTAVADIKRVLSDEQKAELDAIHAMMQERWVKYLED